MEMPHEKIKPFMPLPPREFVGRGGACALLEGAEFFSSGGAALLRALELSNLKGRLWLPHYFCPKLGALLAKVYSLSFYEDLPGESAPRFESLKARPGDAVLALNCFGLGNFGAWKEWRISNGGAILIEDHSHAPFSRWAMESDADFKFASLRKVLPLPDGAYLKGRGMRPSPFFARAGSMQPFAAEALAAAALDAAGVDARSRYYSAESMLVSSRKISRMSAYSLELLYMLDLSSMARRRLENAGIFSKALGKSENFSMLNIPENSGRFAFDFYYPVIRCRDSSLRDKLYAHLRREGIFAAIYWGSMGPCASEPARSLSSRTFVVPIDFRHTAADAIKAAEAFSDFL